MANINDYLEWRADVPFDLDPFNEVDSLVLCELVYTPFDGIVPGPGLRDKISIEEACKRFFDKYSDDEIMARNNMTKLAPFLMKKMCHSRRYGGMKLSGFVNEIDSDDQSQFSVCTFYLNDGSIFVAFRGTDDSLVGWKEDFNMCYSFGTGGQLKAVEYLNKNFYRTMKTMRIGGHSKGGNFAVYGATYCKPHVKVLITDIYNNDGPGFVPEILNDPEYKGILSRVHSFIPSEAIIGMMMYNKFKNKIVISDQKGISQHDPMSWQVVRNHFEYAPKVEESSIIIDEIIKGWTDNVDYDTRAAFGDVFFSSLAASGATKLSQITSGGVRSVASITKEIQSLDKEQQTLIYDIFKKLLNTGSDTVVNMVINKLPRGIKTRIIEK